MRARVAIVTLKPVTFKYELDEPEDEYYQNDGIPWNDREIKNYFIQRAVEDLLDAEDLYQTMTCELEEVD